MYGGQVYEEDRLLITQIFKLLQELSQIRQNSIERFRIVSAVLSSLNEVYRMARVQSTNMAYRQEEHIFSSRKIKLELARIQFANSKLLFESLAEGGLIETQLVEQLVQQYDPDGDDQTHDVERKIAPSIVGLELLSETKDYPLKGLRDFIERASLLLRNKLNETDKLPMGITTEMIHHHLDFVERVQRSFFYIGRDEFEAATNWMNQYINELLASNYHVIVFIPDSINDPRSSAYVSEAVLGKFARDSHPSISPSLTICAQDNQAVGRNADEIVTRGGKVKVLVLDDFIASGNKMGGFASLAARGLDMAGFSKKEQQEIVEVLAIVASRPTFMFSIHSYYNVAANQPYTGEHSDCDYAFSANLSQLVYAINILEDEGSQQDKSAAVEFLIHPPRPYSTRSYRNWFKRNRSSLVYHLNFRDH